MHLALPLPAVRCWENIFTAILLFSFYMNLMHEIYIVPIHIYNVAFKIGITLYFCMFQKYYNTIQGLRLYVNLKPDSSPASGNAYRRKAGYTRSCPTPRLHKLVHQRYVRKMTSSFGSALRTHVQTESNLRSLAAGLSPTQPCVKPQDQTNFTSHWGRQHYGSESHLM